MAERTPGHSLDALLIADHAPPALSGRASILREILVRQPREKTILLAPATAGAKAFDRAARLDARRWPTLPLLGDAAARWLRRRHLRWILGQRRPQMVVAFGTGPEAAMALETRRATGAAVLLHLERPELFAARVALREGGARGRAVRELFDESEAIVVAGRACRLEAYKAGVFPHRIEVIPPGVDLQRFQPGAKPAELLRRIGAEGRRVLLTVAGAGAGKDPDTLLQAFAGLRAGRDGAVLVVLGAADAAWRSRAAALRVQSSVRFVGTVPAAEMPEWYRAADLFVCAHREDREAGVVSGVEVSVVEALASGVPVVGTGVPPMEDLVPEEELGVLVEPGAHAKMARAIQELLASTERREAMSVAARERALAQHSAEVRAARFRELLEVVHFRRLSRGQLPPERESAPAERPAA